MLRRILLVLATIPLAAGLVVSPAQAATTTSDCPEERVCFWAGAGFTGQRVVLAASEIPNYMNRRYIGAGRTDLYKSAKNRLRGHNVAVGWMAGPPETGTPSDKFCYGEQRDGKFGWAPHVNFVARHYRDDPPCS